jgi:hypothetical protein
MSKRKIFSAVFFLAIGTLLIFLSTHRPSNDRNWTIDQRVLPTAEIEGDIAHIKNIRNFVYESVASYTPQYYDKSFDLTTLTSLDYIVEPFGNIGAAHTFLSFGFLDGSYVSVSVEIRKEIGESFSPLKGVLRQYELTYVIADERDVVALRTNHRKDEVYLYPTTASVETIRTLFVDMLTRANELAERPEFYNTLTNNCIINIANHVNALVPKTVPWDYTLIFPANSDVYAQKLGLIAQGMTIEEARAKYRINDAAERFADDPEFSDRIRSVQ